MKMGLRCLLPLIQDRHQKVRPEVERKNKKREIRKRVAKMMSLPRIVMAKEVFRQYPRRVR